MTWFVPPEGYWINVVVVFTVTAILVTNAVLFHRSCQAKGGWFIQPISRYAMRHRARSRTNSLTGISPRPLSTENQQQQRHKQLQQQHLDGGDNRGSAVLPSDKNQWWMEAVRWVERDPNPTTRAIVQGWIDSNDQSSAKRLLMGKRLAFGTSGLRGTMGPGYCCMNDLVVIQTTQGLCRYLEEEGGKEFKKRGVVIGRDHRQHGGVSSEGFARLAASVFVSRGFRVYLMDGTVVPTPLVAFGVSHLKACAGVMVTASHNPKKDNGYKVYWGNGSQIIPPRDAGIAASILRNLEPWQEYNPKRIMAEPLCSNPVDTVAEAYFQGIGDQLCRRPEANACSGLDVVYSAMHGVADAWARRAFLRFSLPPFISVGSQKDPDPEFPTVVFPNPEEPGALKEALTLAEEKGAPLVLANDPDGDRLAAAERQPSGEWHVFSGNEIGVLLGLWQWEEWRRMYPDEDPSKAVMLASTVSSKMLSAAATVEGFTFEETLPGFKWMGHHAQELKAQGKIILFAYEEAIGFGPGDVVFEKDGLSSAALFCEMFVALRDRDGSLEATAVADAASPGTNGGAKGSSNPPLLEGNDCVMTKATGKTVAGSDKILGVNATAPPSPENVVSSLSPSFAPQKLSSISCSLPDAGGDQKREQHQQKEGLEASSVSCVLTRRLKAIHQRYGEFAEENGYVRCEDVQVVSKIFARLRGDGSYLSQFGGHRVTGVRDLSEEHGYDSESVDGRPTLPLVGGGAHFLTFKLGEAGVVATLRTSGTEPKIKYYVEIQGKPGVPLEEVSNSLSKIAAAFVDEALEPEHWGMKRVTLA